MSVSSVLPFTPRLHQACLAPPGPTALQNQRHPALSEAWGHPAYVMMTELATMFMSLWDTVVTMGYPRTRATLLPQARCQCPACEGILPGPPTLAPRVRPAAPLHRA